MEFFEVVHTQRAIRRLDPDPIPDDVLRQILEAAVCAPSGGNRQGWRFLVIRDATLRRRIGDLYRDAWYNDLLKVPYYRDASQAPADSDRAKVVSSSRHLADHIGEAPVLILACLETEGMSAGLTQGASIYPAVQNILLAARALGLGTTLTTIHRFRDREIKTLLGIPDNVETAALIPLGYPLGKFGRAPRKPLAEVAYLDRWGQATGW
ncbi:MAG: nitroreductase family protein [Candidatus Rokubacteria bacterium]|nr:nitroreductase family protein [Candidatus Rokubacteria bacterium]